MAARVRRRGPGELILAGLCSCTAITLRMYAQRKQWPINTVEVSAELTVTGEHGQETYSIARRIKTSGELTPEQRARLADISERTPMTLLLKRGAAIKTTLT
jgi:putative redox protein